MLNLFERLLELCIPIGGYPETVQLGGGQILFVGCIVPCRRTIYVDAILLHQIPQVGESV